MVRLTTLALLTLIVTLFIAFTWRPTFVISWQAKEKRGNIADQLTVLLCFRFLDTSSTKRLLEFVSAYRADATSTNVVVKHEWSNDEGHVKINTCIIHRHEMSTPGTS